MNLNWKQLPTAIPETIWPFTTAVRLLHPHWEHGVVPDSPGSVTSDNATGSLCVVFHSNASLNFAGWAATVSCRSIVEDPAVLQANAISDTRIDLTWNQNPGNSNVMLVWSPDGVFGLPLTGTTYIAGEAISGGGTILYTGAETAYSHTALNASTTYHYRAFSYDEELNYSPGIDAQATTAAAPPSLGVMPLNQNVGDAGGSTSFDVSSNSNWTASSDAVWCDVTLSGNGNGMYYR